MENQDKLIFVGLITSAHGTRGEVIVKSYTNPIANICDLPLLGENGTDKFKLKLVRENNKGQLICKINSTQDRNEAEELKLLKFFCLRSSFPELDEEEFYVEDLKNLPVLDQDNTAIGTVKAVQNFGAGELLEIDLGEQQTSFVPFTKENFPVVTATYVTMSKNDFAGVDNTKPHL